MGGSSVRLCRTARLEGLGRAGWRGHRRHPMAGPAGSALRHHGAFTIAWRHPFLFLRLKGHGGSGPMIVSVN